MGGRCDGKQCVLVLEDERDTREALSLVISAAGYEPVCVADGAEAVKHLESSSAAPCVILLDLMMPGMDGWQFRAWQKASPRFGKVPVVLLSAVRDLSREAQGLDVEGFLAKPVKLDPLIELIEKFCGQAAA